VKAEEFAKIFGFFDSLSFPNDQALGIDDFVVLQINLRVVVEVEDLFKWAEMLLGSAVALKTPPHGVTLGMINLLHLVDLSVTTHAGDSPIKVSGVVEIDVIWSLVNTNPLDGLSVDWIPVGIHNRAVKLINSHGGTKSSKLG
jgi:hypothetical protein